MKYTIEQIKEIMESGEPIFVMRAKDKSAVAALEYYRDNTQIYDSNISDWQADLNVVIDKFEEWETKNPDKMKYPD